MAANALKVIVVEHLDRVSEEFSMVCRTNELFTQNALEQLKHVAAVSARKRSEALILAWLPGRATPVSILGVP